MWTHGGREAFIPDLVRFTSLVSAGWRPLCFTWEQVMFRREWVLERVQDTIDAGGTGGSKAAQQPSRRSQAAA